MPPPCSSRRVGTTRARAFTIVEALVAVVILMIFALTSTMALNFFDERAARNRNAEAARAVVEDYVNHLLSDSTYATNALTVTAAGTDLDGDGVPDGEVCTALDGRAIPASIPLIVRRIASPTTTPDGVVVNGTLFWKVQAVGAACGCPADKDLMQVNFLLRYIYRSQTYYYKAMTFKANP